MPFFSAHIPAACPVAAAAGGRPKVGDALAFLQDVKQTFGGDQRYQFFLEVMRKFKAKELATVEVRAAAAELFQAYPELTIGFNRFLPADHRIALQDVQMDDVDMDDDDGGGGGWDVGEEDGSNDDDDGSDGDDAIHEMEVMEPDQDDHKDHLDPRAALARLRARFAHQEAGFQGAVAYVQAVKKRLAALHRPDLYRDHFLSDLQAYKAGRLGIADIKRRMDDLFLPDHPDLAKGFEQFLPGAGGFEAKARGEAAAAAAIA